MRRPEVLEDIDIFEHSLGLRVRGFKKACTKKDAAMKLDEKRSAFGTTLNTPSDFVPSKPVVDNNRKKTRPQSASSTRRPQSASCARKYETTRPEELPIDFVYDLETRKKLRAAIDSERHELLELNQEREQDLRDADLWLVDKRRPRKEKVCWSTPRRNVPTPTRRDCSLEKTSPLHQALDEIVWARPKKQRPKSAVNRRNSVAENVHFSEWQTSPYHTEAPSRRRRK
ncbi:hypothetical protein LEN26_012004 [Aphanomyces euteiches]|nr:hypothetical protein AeMF1_012029 [Aphanomyces euteiches]KAH9118613.1 hypothetical protein LEN26_012004 [Aphanomyces euteiches]KAH9191917.1 hypothetical protein AeNC1_006105 [Aphanomyces euteiches]